ncbi:MAG: adenosylcobinamide-GDP ribazoletransferase, partial [Firmicutes bacterium]|nr:adenosylcobinamide-GDP ribazoletransferase [Bacillota bacterium]
LFLPLVGLLIGALWTGLARLLGLLGAPALVAGALLCVWPMAASGFMHVDGYMDVNDAVMSRGTLEKKRAILKDSRCGTFAIVSFIFLVLTEFGFMYGALDKDVSIDPVRLVMIMIMARSFSGLMMATRRPMDTSQYVSMKRDRKAEAFMLIQLAVYLAAGMILGAEFSKVLLTVCVSVIGTIIPILLAERDLQGMNGDIAGYGILWGEMLGIVTLIF